MCYRDKTFCEARDCKKWNGCPDALTNKVETDASRWWGKEGAPISVYIENPKCFEGDE